MRRWRSLTLLAVLVLLTWELFLGGATLGFVITGGYFGQLAAQVSTLLGLTDVPDNLYTGNAGEFVVVNPTADGIEAVNLINTADGIAGLDPDGGLDSLTTRIADVWKVFTGVDPGAGSCDYQGQTLLRSDTGKFWGCASSGAGTNPTAYGAFLDFVNAIILDDQSAVAASGPSQLTLRSRLRVHATDCTALTDGKEGQTCLEMDTDPPRVFMCKPTAGDCSGTEWKLLTKTGDMAFGKDAGDPSCAAAALYIARGSTGTNTTTEIVRQPIGHAVTLTSIYVQQPSDNAMDTGITATYVVQVDEVDTAVTVNVAPAAFSNSATGFSVAVAAGQRVRIKETCAGGTEAGKHTYITVGYTR